MHNDLWAGVELKFRNAEFHLRKMGQSIEPPEQTAYNVVLESSGAIIDTGWRISFYAYLDAFLSATRSVAEIIKCCFGADTHPKMKKWFDARTVDEKDRRKEFRKRFQSHYNKFCALPLGTARHISEHRMGYAPVTVSVSGMFGVTYTGGPTTPVPISETRQIDDPDLAFLAKPRAIHPGWDDFEIDGQGLFTACQKYLEGAQTLIAEARAISTAVHGNELLTAPDF